MSTGALFPAEERSYWGDAVRCGACYVGRHHTHEQHTRRILDHLAQRHAQGMTCTCCPVDLDN